MTREERAKQFSPFDALKGLRDALRLKEYEHEKTLKGDLPVEEIEKISKTLQEIKKTDTISITYYYDGYYKTTCGQCKIEFENQRLKIASKFIKFDDIYKIEIIQK